MNNTADTSDDLANDLATDLPGITTRIEARLAARHRAEKRFRLLSILAVWVGLAFLGVLFVIIVHSGADAFRQTKVLVDVRLEPKDFGAPGTVDRETLGRANYQGLMKRSLREAFPQVTSRKDRKGLYRLVSSGAAFELREKVLQAPELIGQTISIWVTASDDVDMIVKGVVPRKARVDHRRLGDNQMGWLE
ncbi:MAG: DUF3333 domain-containing protein, partial [Proteobacteria bacterium]|nr:DUF3333 domain-containing protein [Pseudomonadota bacterium]